MCMNWENLGDIVYLKNNIFRSMIINQEGYLRAPKQCEFREEGRWIYLKVRGGELKYPRPSNWVSTGQVKFEKGDLIGTAYNTTSPIYKLNALIKLMR